MTEESVGTEYFDIADGGSDEDGDDDGWMEDAEVACGGELVAAARRGELGSWGGFGAGEVVCAKQAAKSGCKMLRARWVSAERPRGWGSRCVGKEFRAVAPKRGRACLQPLPPRSRRG